MAIAEELHVKSLIQPYSNSIIQAIKEAWSLWLQSPFFGKWSSRGRATFVWETVINLLKEKFMGRSDVFIIDKGVTVLFVIQQQVVFRFKLADRTGRSKNVQTDSAKSFHDPELNYNLLAEVDIASNIPRIEVIYTLNKSATQIDNIKMIARDKNSVAWNVSLIDSQTSFVEFDESKDTSDFDTVKDNQTKRRFKGKSTGGGFKKAEGES